MKRIICTVLLCLFLSGCSGWTGGSFSSVVPHDTKRNPQSDPADPISNYTQIRSFLTELVESGSAEGKATLSAYKEEDFARDMDSAIRYVTERNPIGAYAVEQITYERGTIKGLSAVAVQIVYRQDRTNIKSINQVDTVTDARELISQAMKDMDAHAVIRIRKYTETDLAQFALDYSMQYPEYVMEVPEITVNFYPDTGSDRVVEISFRYQTSRDVLRTMQSYVEPVFMASRLNVIGEESQAVRFDLMYSFLMERNDCQFDASLTPTYSLLRYGVGDSKAFATVFAAMCSRAGLNCQVVSGTKDAEVRFWNIICEDGVYTHVDLLESSKAGHIQRRYDDQMTGYVWDYSAYPACVLHTGTEVPEATEPVAETQPEEQTE